MEIARLEAALTRERHQHQQHLARLDNGLRQPLSTLSGLATLALDSDSDEQRARYLGQIGQTIETLSGALFTELAEAPPATATAVPLRIESFELSILLESVVEACAASARERTLALRVIRAPDTHEHFLGDAPRLIQALVHVLRHVLDMAVDGEVRIVVSEHATDAQAMGLQFSIQHSGNTRSSTRPDALLEALHEKEGQTRHLTLAISWRLVELMHGRISAPYLGDKETQFNVDVRLLRAAAAGTEAHGGLPTALRGQAVLIADDNGVSRDILKHTLTDLGLQPIAVNGGIAAVEAYQQNTADAHPYPLIILDWHMPDLDGLGAAQRIRASSAEDCQPTILMVSAYSEEAPPDDPALHGTIDALLPKPVNRDLLLSTLVTLFPDSTAPNATMAPSLPIHGSAAAARPKTGPGGLILVADDCPITRGIIQGALDDHGISVIQVDNGQALLETAESGDFDLILTDIEMPGPDGREVCRRLRAGSRHARTPIIAMSAHGQAEFEQQCLNAGMNAYLRKPINPEHLLELITKHLGPVPPGADGAPPGTARASKDEHPGIDTAKALMIASGKHDMMLSLRARFLSEHRDTVERIEALISEGKSVQASHLAHTLKGASAAIGAEALCAASGELERQLRDALDATEARAILRAAAATLWGPLR
ncbi:MAG: response regulator [Gammaproteobacteria bacterium]